ncbi:hypothetical protein K1T71_000516 [Dendrolimus kikuchii]|uniref:Uncharacterized protein n=1 Tax=Dendrolimus kikuchii TaxID=765133 RepID=A0ACC1DK95_9NEOP|nr:hypothetical protein K1T71_000516 [Dendrolimus kikuchii]
MQANEADSKNPKINGDDDSINFRPSQNFIYMKKYLKSKFVEESSASNSANSDSDSPSMSNEQQHNKEPANQQASEGQPPLPPNPPSPDTPVVIKTEKEDVEEYPCNPDTQEVAPNESATFNTNTQATAAENKDEEETMCRNFIRGTCERGATCIFVHKLILSQLKHVYRFCINFQNRSGCNRPHCKFVHATVFEQEHFFKTGVLPPHTMAHLKQENAAPPPSAEVTETQPAETSTVFHNQQPAPMQLAVMEQPKPESSAGVSVMDILAPAVAGKSPLKREWSEVDNNVESNRDHGDGMPVSKKCKECDLNEIRLQFSKKMCEFLQLSLKDVKKRMAILNRKYAKLITLLISLLNQKSSTGDTFLNPIAGKETMLISQLIRLMGSQQRLKMLHESRDSIADETFLMRLLLAVREAQSKK